VKRAAPFSCSRRPARAQRSLDEVRVDLLLRTLGHMQGGKSKRPLDTKFRQQNDKRWHPLLTPVRTVILYLCIGVVFVIIGVTITSAADGVIEVESADYSTSCCIANCSSKDHTTRVDLNPCNVTLTVSEKMEAPVYLYYKISNFFQNHRRYVKSRSDAQLAAEPVTESDLEDDCEEQLYLKTPEGGKNKSLIIYPCGLVAWSLFNDTLEILNSSSGKPLDAVTEKGIAWQTDIDYKFSNNPDGTSGLNFAGFAYERSQRCADLPTQIQKDQCFDANITEAGWCYPGSGYCYEDEHFIVWMRTAARPNFRKLYAIINTDLDPGTYVVSVSNGRILPGYPGYQNPWLSRQHLFDASAPPVPQNFLWPSHPFGSKSIVLSTTSWVGGKNSTLGVLYILVGSVCMALALVLGIMYARSPRQLGAPR